MRTSDDLVEQFQAAVSNRRIPGIAARVCAGDEVIFEGAFGISRIGDDAPLSIDAIFRIASMSKAITTVAAMQLVDRGRLKLDDPIGDVVPELAQPQVLEGFGPDGSPRLRPARRPITLRHLLTHTSGLGSANFNPDVKRYAATMGLPPQSSCTVAGFSLPLTFDPGDRWQYGVSVDWAGRAVENVSGLRLDKYLVENIFEPLGMPDTGFDLTAGQRKRLSAMHSRNPASGALTAIDHSMPTQPEFLMGGGGLYGTVADYVRFLDLFRGQGVVQGHRLLTESSVRLMLTNQIGHLPAGVLTSQNPGSSNDIDLFPGIPQRWSMGFLLNMDRSAQGRSAGSVCWAGLTNTYFWYDPQRDVRGVFMTQLFPFGDHEALRLFRLMEQHAYDCLIGS